MPHAVKFSTVQWKLLSKLEIALKCIYLVLRLKYIYQLNFKCT